MARGVAAPGSLSRSGWSECSISAPGTGIYESAIARDSGCRFLSNLFSGPRRGGAGAGAGHPLNGSIPAVHAERRFSGSASRPRNSECWNDPQEGWSARYKNQSYLVTGLDFRDRSKRLCGAVLEKRLSRRVELVSQYRSEPRAPICLQWAENHYPRSLCRRRPRCGVGFPGYGQCHCRAAPNRSSPSANRSTSWMRPLDAARATQRGQRRSPRIPEDDRLEGPCW